MIVFVFSWQAHENRLWESKPPNAIVIPHCMYDGLECLISRQIMDGGLSKSGLKKSYILGF
jgi:hypothetical protein